MFIGKTDAEAETPILWPPHAKSWPIGKDPDAGMDTGQEEKGMTEDEMAGFHHQLDAQESDTTERLNWTGFIKYSCSNNFKWHLKNHISSILPVRKWRLKHVVNVKQVQSLVGMKPRLQLKSLDQKSSTFYLDSNFMASFIPWSFIPKHMVLRVSDPNGLLWWLAGQDSKHRRPRTSSDYLVI